MPASRYPCRVCGQSTEGQDSYVVCPPCVEDFEMRAGERESTALQAFRSPAEPPVVPLSPDEVEARLRKLLDDW